MVEVFRKLCPGELAQGVLEMTGSFVIWPRPGSFLSSLTALRHRLKGQLCSLPSRLQDSPLPSLVASRWPGSFLNNSRGPYLPGPQRATPLGLASPSEAATVSILVSLCNARENQSMLSLSLIVISLLKTEDLNHFLQKNPS